jgi:hypothetical protein
MKALKVDENGFKWMKKVKMDELLATRIYYLGPNFAKNRPEVKNSPSAEISPVKKTLNPGEA